MKKYAILAGLVVLAIVAALWVANRTVKAPGDAQACTMEAKLCPDGSAVGRTGPNCEFAECPPLATSTATSTLAIGESATINGLAVSVLGLAEDSRCPIDVQCIQAGTVRVNVSVDSYKGALTLTLGEPQVVQNEIIMLVSVTPKEKRSTQTVSPGDYRFTFIAVPLEATAVGAGIP